MFTDTGLNAASALLGIDKLKILTVAEKESRGAGFLSTGTPVILYEPYKFGEFTDGKWNKVTILINGVSYPLSLTGKWNREKSMYGPKSIQHQKLTAASELDRYNALQSCSWGKFQVMGFNWKMLGYPSLQDFINAMYRSEDDHLEAFCRYVKVRKLHVPLRNGDWDTFADGYNGSASEANDYAGKCREIYNRLKKQYGTGN